VVLQVILIPVPVLKSSNRHETLILTGKHLGYEYVEVAIVIDISHISTHGSTADAIDPLGKLLGKRAILIVDVQVIALEKVVWYKDVQPAVVIDVPYRDAQSEPNYTSIDTSVDTDVGETVAIVSHQLIAAQA